MRFSKIIRNGHVIGHPVISITQSEVQCVTKRDGTPFGPRFRDDEDGWALARGFMNTCGCTVKEDRTA